MVAADAGMTPEEKLLRIIEAPGEAKAHALKPSFNFQASSLYVKSWVKHYQEKVLKSLSLKMAIKALAGICAAATFFMIADFLIGLPNMSMISNLEKAAKHSDLGKVAIGSLNPLAVFQQEIGQHNIFSLPPAGAIPQAAEAAKAKASEEIAQAATASLKLVGIIWSDMPQAMIEDEKDGRTQLVSRGAKIRDARVKEILKDRVILLYDDQDVELR